MRYSTHRRRKSSTYVRLMINQIMTLPWLSCVLPSFVPCRNTDHSLWRRTMPWQMTDWQTSLDSGWPVKGKKNRDMFNVCCLQQDRLIGWGYFQQNINKLKNGDNIHAYFNNLHKVLFWWNWKQNVAHEEFRHRLSV